MLFILEEDFVDDSSKPVASLSCGDRVHLNLKGVSVWLRKVRTFLELGPALTQPIGQRAADQKHQPDERVGVPRVHYQRAFVSENLPTVSVTGNRAAEHSLHADESIYTDPPVGNERPAVPQRAATSHGPDRNTVYPMPFLHPVWPSAPYRPTPWLNPFCHWYPRSQLQSYKRVY